MSEGAGPATYGDVTGEYLALRDGAAVVTGERELLWVTGPDCLSFLDGLLSQDVAALEPGTVARSLLLEPRGKLRALLWLARGTDRVGIVADAGLGPVVAGDLARYLMRVDVTIGDDVEPLIEVWGPGAPEVLAAAGLTAPVGWEVAASGAVVMSLPLGALPRFALTGVAAPDLEAAGARPAGSMAVTTVRVEGGEPKMGVDVDEATIPQESGLVDASVSFTKGCYLGQELVARIDSRGHVNRHLRGVVITENVLPPLGATLRQDDRAVGTLTSLGESLHLRAPVGLALVRREVAPGDTVAVRWDAFPDGGRSEQEGARTGDAKAVIRELPLDDFNSG